MYKQDYAKNKTFKLVYNPPFANNYARTLLLLDHGKGCYLFDADGNRYLDFGSGIAVNALGHGREDLAAIAAEQMKKIVHVSNLYTTEPALQCAGRLMHLGNFDAVYFGNSGTEAVEAALKFARLYALRTKGEGHHRIASFSGAFHGRTMGALSATHTPAYQDPFRPLVPGCTALPYNDVDALKNNLDDSYAAVIVEPLQGEGGLRSVTPGFAEALNSICREMDIVLIADEVQTGLGRTGEILACSWAGLNPDMVTLAKPLAGGLPLSAVLVPERINKQINVGEHASTFGGGPVTTAVAGAVLDIICDAGFIKQVQEAGEHLHRRLKEICQSSMLAKEVRGHGLLAGIAVGYPEKDAKLRMGSLIEKLQDRGLLALRSGINILRIAPPLIIEKDQIDEGCDIIAAVLAEETEYVPRRQT
jgi:acetylornithine/N-succinyldiaminopimelate aminotransferase